MSITSIINNDAQHFHSLPSILYSLTPNLYPLFPNLYPLTPKTPFRLQR